jgi:hypothetical protein
MDIKKYLGSRAFWAVKRPSIPVLAESFDDAVQSGEALRLTSFPDTGVYIADKFIGDHPVEATPLLMGYFLTEYTFSKKHGWPDGKSRLQALLQWAELEEDLQSVRAGNDRRFSKGNKPTVIEWALWYTKAVELDVEDKAIPIEEKRVLVKLLEETIYNASRARSLRKNGFLLPSERAAVKKIDKMLQAIFKFLSIPVSAQFALEYNPTKFLASVQAGLTYEAYRAQEGTFYGPPKGEDVGEAQELTPERLKLLHDTLPALFLFEKGTSIKSLLKGARVQKGLPTVEPNVPFDVPPELQKRYSLPARLAYKNCIRETGSYLYHEIDADGKMITPPISVPSDVYQELRVAAAPLLVLPDGLPKAKYLGADPEDREMFLFRTEDGVELRLTREQKKQVIDLNPNRTSNDVRGRIDHLFTEFFITDIRPHYAQYLGGFSREALVDLANTVKAKIAPTFATSWEKIAALPESAREEAAVKAMGDLFQAVSPFPTPEDKAKVEASQKQLMSKLCKNIFEKIKIMVYHEAEKKAVVNFFESKSSLNGPGGEGEYKFMNYREKYELWKTAICEAVDPQERDVALRQAIQTAVKGVDLEALIPETHKPNVVYHHFIKSAGEELKQRLKALGLPEPRRGLDGLVDVASMITYLPVEIFFDRRLTVFERGMQSAAAPSWPFSLDKPLPSVNLRDIRLKEIKAQRTKACPVDPAQQEFYF